MSAAVAGNQLLALHCIIEDAENVEKCSTRWQSVISCAKVRGDRLLVHHTDYSKGSRSILAHCSRLLGESGFEERRGQKQLGRKAVLRQHKLGRWG